MFQNENNHLRMTRNKYLYNKKINLSINIDYLRLTSIIKNILLNFCNPSIIGYFTYDDTYWIKKIYDKRCIIHITIKILKVSHNVSVLYIKPELGNFDDIHNFIYLLKEGLNLYDSCPFIKKIIEKGSFV